MEVGEEITVVVIDDEGDGPNTARPINEPDYAGKTLRVYGGKAGRVYSASIDSEHPEYFQLRILERKVESSLNAEEKQNLPTRRSHRMEYDYAELWEKQQRGTRSDLPKRMS